MIMTWFDALSNQIKAFKPVQREEVLYKLVTPSVKLEDWGFVNGAPPK